MRELPAGLAHHLHQSCRHAIEHFGETKLAADCFRFSHMFCRSRPESTHEDVKGKCLRKNMVFVKLRGRRDPLPPAAHAKRLPVQPIQQQQAGTLGT